MKILVADDEKAFTGMLRDFLTQKGHDVDVASDGNQVIDLLKREFYNVALLDMTMPGRTGLEIVEYIRSKNLPTKAFLVTAYLGAEEDLILASGATGLLQKPIELSQIDTLLQSLR